MSSKKRKVVGVLLTDQEWAKLEEMRSQDLRSMSNLVSLALKAWIEKHG